MTITLKTDPIHRWQRDCLRKMKYRNKRHARIAAKRAERKFGKKMRFYDCDECDFWHLTSMPFTPSHKKEAK